MNNPSSSSSSSLPLSGNNGNQPQEQTSATPRPPSPSSSSPHQQQPKKGIFEHIMSNNSDHFVLSSRHYSYKEALHRPVPLNNNKQYALDHITRTCLPYPVAWTPTAGPGQMPPDFSWLANSCGGKAALGVFGGGIMVRCTTAPSCRQLLPLFFILIYIYFFAYLLGCCSPRRYIIYIVYRVCSWEYFWVPCLIQLPPFNLLVARKFHKRRCVNKSRWHFGQLVRCLLVFVGPHTNKHTCP